MIYFVRCTLTDLVKIGHATNPHSRLAKMQSDSPGTLILLGVEQGGAEREAEIHARFAHCRVRGEWFQPDSALNHHLETLEQLAKQSRRKRLSGAIGKWIAEKDISASEFADRIGASKATVSGLCSGRVMPSWPMMERIARVTDEAILPNDFIPTGFPNTRHQPPTFPASARQGRSEKGSAPSYTTAPARQPTVAAAVMPELRENVEAVARTTGPCGKARERHNSFAIVP